MKEGLATVLIRAAEYPVQPWKNGQGTTREIAVDGEVPFRWRLSWAHIGGGGPFSEYPGYDRILVPLRGAVRLSHEGKPGRDLPAFQPHRFKGEWKTEAEVSAPAEDFNLFLLREKAKANVY